MDFDFCPTLKELYRTSKALTEDRETIEATGLSSVNNLATIRGVIKSFDCTDTLEVGLAFGGSALTVLATMEEEAGGKPFSHYAIDPFQSNFKNAGVTMVAEAGYSEHFKWIEEASETALPELFKSSKRFDFIYIDGSHIFEHVFVDAFFSTMLLKSGGVMLFDDCADPNVTKVTRFLDRNFSDQLDKVDLSQFGNKKSFIKTVANKFGYAQLKGYRKTGDLPREWNAKFRRF